MFMREQLEPKISALPLKAWLAKQGRGGRTQLARKLNISAGRLSNWLRRGIPKGQVYPVAIEMGISYPEYLLQAGALPPNAKPAQGSLEEIALLADFEQLPDGLKAHVARKTEELRELYESLPSFLQASLKKRPDPESYKEWEKGIEELMTKYKREEK